MDHISGRNSWPSKLIWVCWLASNSTILNNKIKGKTWWRVLTHGSASVTLSSRKSDMSIKYSLLNRWTVPCWVCNEKVLRYYFLFSLFHVSLYRKKTLDSGQGGPTHSLKNAAWLCLRQRRKMVSSRWYKENCSNTPSHLMLVAGWAPNICVPTSSVSFLLKSNLGLLMKKVLMMLHWYINLDNEFINLCFKKGVTSRFGSEVIWSCGLFFITMVCLIIWPKTVRWFHHLGHQIDQLTTIFFR